MTISPLIKYFILITFIVCNLLQVNAQKLEPTFYNLNDELSSSEIYDLYQDEIGYVWIATDKGVVKYDGNEFESIELFEQIKAKVIFNFHEESAQKVWINTDQNKLFWFNPLNENFVLTPYIYNDLLSTSINSLHDREFIKNIRFKDENIFVTFFRGTGYIKISKSGNVELESETNNKEYEKNKSNLCINVNKEGVYTDFLGKGVKHPKLVFIANDTTIIDERPNLSKYDYFGITENLKEENIRYMSFNKYILAQKKDTILSVKLPSDIQSLSVNGNNIIVGTVKGVYHLNKELNVINSYLKDYTITSILKDKNDGYWFSTLEKGIFYTANLSITKIPDSDKLNTTYLKFENDSLLIFHNNNELYLYTGEQLHGLNHKIYKNNKYIRSSSNQLGKFFYPLKPFYDDFGGVIYDYLEADTFTYVAKYKFISNYSGNGYYAVEAEEGIPYFNDCSQLNDSSLLVLTKKGLYFYDITTRKIGNQSIYENISFYNAVKFNSRIILNSSSGVFEYDHGQIQPLSRFSFNFKVENDSIIWLFSDRGLFRVHEKPNNNFSYIKYNKENGLLSNNILDIDVDSNQLWVSTRNGINNIQNYKEVVNGRLDANRFMVDSIVSNGIKLIDSDTIQINYRKDLNFYFKYLSFFQSVQIEYKLDQGKYIRTNNKSVNIQGLEPGSHQLVFKIKKDSGECVYIDKKLIVPTPFQKSGVFMLLLILLIGVLFFILFKVYFNYKSVQNKKEIRRLKLELNQLNSQMNPHFTFNTINSIQHYILKNDKHKAIAYLSDFALMMRKTLEMSKKGIISVKNEVDFLKLYINLENKRFDEPFNFKISVGDNIDLATTFIPPLMLQPLIENCVKHAFTAKDDNKIIELIFTKENGLIKIQVIDNGRGVKQNPIEKKHESYATELIRNRLKVFNNKNFRESDFQIVFVNKSEKTGTIVTLIIHQNENFTS
ncbi:MAG: histidine kinase [Putridiphycobacter sp.]